MEYSTQLLQALEVAGEALKANDKGELVSLCENAFGQRWGLEWWWVPRQSSDPA